MSSRKIQHPGIELNEIDRSYYGKVDNSLPNAPTTLIFGFASKGADYALQWIDLKSTLDTEYGIPTTEYEQYFYNGICEVLNRGGMCIAAKLPYANHAKDQYNYVDYTVQLCSTSAMITGLDVDPNFQTIGEFHTSLIGVIDYMRKKGFEYDGPTESMRGMSQAIDELSAFVNESSASNEEDIRTVANMFQWLSSFIVNYGEHTSMFALQMSDPSITSYLDIKLSGDGTYGGMSPLSALDALITRINNGNLAIVKQNHFRIYDITRSQYGIFTSPDTYVSSIVSGMPSNEFLGIVPVVVTPANAMFFQNLLDFKYLSADIMASFNQVSALTALGNLSVDTSGMSLSTFEQQLVLPMQSIADGVNGYNGIEQMMQWTSQESVSRKASMQFPLIDYDGIAHFSREHLKKVGIVVFKAFKDSDNNGKIGFQLLESFIGSFDKNARDPVTKANLFIDDVVNSQSQFIKLFSNIDKDMFVEASTLATSQQPAVSMGFYKVDCKKAISYAESIMMPLTRMLDNASNPDTLPLDIVVDAGMSNIANAAKYAQQHENGIIDTDAFPMIADSQPKQLGSLFNSGWRAYIKKLDDFAKYTRKDCMFLVDGLRAFCLDGNAKIVRSTCPCNSVAKTVLPNLRAMSGLFDSSYAAGYCNWFYQKDNSSGDYIWIPPSIKAAGVYIYCDTYFQPWSAPAGMTRGVLNDVVDVAFVPGSDEAGKIYSARWNYAMSYPLDGIVIEGHKTFQSQMTALDRVNVRRLMLYLEKQTARIARWFVYEGNTPYLRQRFVDTLRPVFEDAVRRDGVLEYAIKCDDDINTTQVIENNELRCRIAVKPVKCVDFIVIDMICTRQNANVSEEVLQ